MIEVISANDDKPFFINHRRIISMKVVDSKLQIKFDNEKRFIVSNDIEDIKNKIIEFENAIMTFQKSNKKITEEVLKDE